MNKLQSKWLLSAVLGLMMVGTGCTQNSRASDVWYNTMNGANEFTNTSQGLLELFAQVREIF